jgi:SAM-dependent methyltransferase
VSAHPLRALKRQLRGAAAYGRFLADFATFRRLSFRAGRDLSLRWRDQYPCLADRTNTTPFDPHYTYHTAWAARVLAELRPERHVDIGSSLMFIVSVSAFVPVDFYDYRPAPLGLSGLRSLAADLTSLPFADRSLRSLSCMHVVEHVGLGRYGDPLDPAGDLTAMRELQRVVAPGGSLLFVVPVGQPRVCYNAHRIYSYEQIVEAFAELRVRQFALIPDGGAHRDGLILDADPHLVARQKYGCGCFWLERPQ